MNLLKRLKAVDPGTLPERLRLDSWAFYYFKYRLLHKSSAFFLRV